MNTQNPQGPKAQFDLKCDLEGFEITPEDEEAIRDAVEQQLRGLPVHAQEQK